MKKWEYNVITIATNAALTTKQYERAAQEFETQLNALGAEGWELVQRMDGFFSSKGKKWLPGTIRFKQHNSA